MALFSNDDWSHIPNAHADHGVWAYCWQPARPELLSEFLQEGALIVEGEAEAKRLFGESAGKVLLDSKGWIRKHEFVLLRWPWERRMEIYKIEQEKADEAVLATRSGSRVVEAIDGLKNRHIRPFVVDAQEYPERRATETRESTNRVGWTGATPA